MFVVVQEVQDLSANFRDKQSSWGNTDLSANISSLRSLTWFETELDTDGELSCIMSGGKGCFHGNIFQGVRGRDH